MDQHSGAMPSPGRMSGFGARVVAQFTCALAPLARGAGATLAVMSGQDPKVVSEGRTGERWAAYRSGLQVVIGGGIVGAASYTALLTALGPDMPTPILCCVAITVSGAIVGIDIAAMEKARQLHAEAEAKLFKFVSRQSRSSLLKLAALTGARFCLAVFNTTFFATLLMTVLLHTDIANVLAEEAELHNRPIVAAIARDVDAIIAADQANLEAKNRLLAALSASVPLPPAPPSDLAPAADVTKPFDTQLDQLVRLLTTLRARTAELETTIAGLQKTMACEQLGNRCDTESSGLEGKGKKYQLAANLLQDAQARKLDLQQQVADAVKAQGALLLERGTALSQRQQGAAADEERRRNADAAAEEHRRAAIATAQHEVDAALAAYQGTLRGREAAIATRLHQSPEFAVARTGLSASISALQQLEERPGHWQFVASLKGLLVLLELNALATVLLWPTRRTTPLVEYLNYSEDAENAVFQAQRRREQRPPLEAYRRF